MQSAANPSPQANSLLTGKITGNFAESGQPSQFSGPFRSPNSITYSRIPYAKEQGILKGVSGNFLRGTGNSVVSRCGRLHPRRNETTRASKSEEAIDRFAQPFVLLACVLASPAALAQTYPDRNVTIVVTTAAGALTDTLTRAVAQQLSEMWKQSVVVENRSGAGYSIAAQSVMRGEHDGYTLLASETGFYTTQPHLYAEGKLAYDAEKDFVPVAGYGTFRQRCS
jgi:Tripartite tricarboxylate transporter family receptor